MLRSGKYYSQNENNTQKKLSTKFNKIQVVSH